MPVSPYIIKSLPGIKRDGTRFENGFYVDGQWCRFQRGLPRKMGGYRTTTDEVPQICRGLNSYNEDGRIHLVAGSESYLTQFEINTNGVVVAKYDRTPAGFAGDDAHLWTFDNQFDSVGVSPGSYILAHPGKNLHEIDSSATSDVYWGLSNGTTALIANSAPAVSGGVISLFPYAFVYGSNGYVAWSVAGNPDDWTSTGAGDGYITGQKIVAALPLRSGPGNAPAGLFWSLDSLIRCTFVGGDPVFQFDTITSQSSILSAQGVIEYDGIFFWAGVDRFLQFNGVVREVPNQLNQNWFFDNLNYNQRQKVFAYKVPRFGEIWWCYPRGDATECTHAVIYNIRENTWYDTKLPGNGRSCGEFVSVYQFPFMTDAEVDPVTSQSKLWQNEFGYDELDGVLVNSIPSYFQTADISLVADPQGAKNKSLRCVMIEPDFVQSGDMTVQISGRANARAPEAVSEEKTFTASAATLPEQVVFFKDIRREMRFIFRSNVIGGNYQMGQCIAHIDVGDGTVLG